MNYYLCYARSKEIFQSAVDAGQLDLRVIHGDAIAQRTNLSGEVYSVKEMAIVQNQLDVQDPEGSVRMHQCLVDEELTVPCEAQIRTSSVDCPDTSVKRFSDNSIRIQLTKGRQCLFCFSGFFVIIVFFSVITKVL